MINSKLNPLWMMLITFVLCIISGIIIMHCIGGDATLVVLMNTVYFTPVICFIIFNVLSILNRSWFQRNRLMAMIINLILIGLIIAIIIHIVNLFE